MALIWNVLNALNENILKLNVQHVDIKVLEFYLVSGFSNVFCSSNILHPSAMGTDNMIGYSFYPFTVDFTVDISNNFRIYTC